MKSLFLAILTTFTTVNTGQQLDKNAAKDQAKDVLSRASGKASRFIYDELKQISLTGRSSGEPAKPEVTQTRLANRLYDLEMRLDKVLDRCGPGVERPKNALRKVDVGDDEEEDSPINLEGRAGGWGSHGPAVTPIFDADFDRISAPRPNLPGQTGFDLQNVIDPFGSMGGIGLGFGTPDIFGHSSNLPVGFDPLGAGGYEGSFRRKRYADGERVTKAKIKKKLQRLQSSFEPMETFLDTELENCAKERVSSLRAKVTKVKTRVEKVIRRQGMTILQKQRKRRT